MALLSASADFGQNQMPYLENLMKVNLIMKLPHDVDPLHNFIGFPWPIPYPFTKYFTRKSWTICKHSLNV